MMYSNTPCGPLIASTSAGFLEPSVIWSPASRTSPSLTFSLDPKGIKYVLLSSFDVTVTSFLFFSSLIETFPAISVIIATPFGLRASKSSSTLGRPCVMSATPATPPDE